MVDLYSSPPIDIRNRPLVGVDQLVVPDVYRNDLKGIMLSEGEMRNRVERIAADISIFPIEGDLLSICMLKGAMYFFTDLNRALGALDYPVEFGTLGSESYHGEESTGKVILSPFDYDKIPGRDVLIVEDIIDTGRTLDKVVNKMGAHNPRSLRVACLFDKPSRRLADVTLQPDYIGFKIPDEFIIGGGLDFDGRYRNLPHVAVLKDELRS